MAEKTYALIRSGKVLNIIVADQSFADIIRPEWDAVIETTNKPEAYIGGEYKAGAFVPRPVA